MNRKKIFSFLVLSLAAVFSTTPFAAAAAQTGYSSGGWQTEKINNSFESVNFNQEMMYNEMLGAVNAGSNGQASIAAELQNEINFTEVGYDAAMVAGDAVNASNSNTGCESCNKAQAQLENEIEVENSNLAWIMNLLKLKASNGQNKNSGSSAGAATVDVSVKNSANANTTDIASSLNGTVSASNSNTGAHSENKAQAQLKNDIDVDNYNFADIANKIEASAKTGENKNCGSRPSCSFQTERRCPANSPCPTTTPTSTPATGDAESIIEVINMVNSNETDIEINFEPAMVAAYNADTGYGSSNTAKAELENEIDVDNYNMAFVTNIIKNEANSGSNDSGNQAWGGNSQSSGDATAQTEIGNYANLNKTSVNADFGGDIIASNSNTGCESYNNAEVEVKNEIEVENENLAEIHNYVENSANSGENGRDAKKSGCRDCSDQDSSTGNAFSSVEIVNQLNMNETEISADFGGDVLAANSMTGAMSENKSQAEVSNSIEVVNKNFAEVSNYVSVESSSENNNSADYSGGTDDASDSGASLIITNQSNKNVVKVE